MYIHGDQVTGDWGYTDGKLEICCDSMVKITRILEVLMGKDRAWGYMLFYDLNCEICSGGVTLWIQNQGYFLLEDQVVRGIQGWGYM